MAETGFLVLADISGFTAFTVGAELDHGPEIIAELLDTVIQSVSPALTVEALEGDAVFALGPDRSFGRAEVLFDLMESAFVAFKLRQRQMHVNTFCTCNACRQIPCLNLKLIAHHGQFHRQQVGGRTQVTGPDVILVHRLLKNRLQDRTGYLLVTQQALRRIGLDPDRNGMQQHDESYDHLGSVCCHVTNLEPVWERIAENRVVRLEEDQVLARLVTFVPLPPPVAWDWVISPDKRHLYEDEIVLTDDLGEAGRPGRGMQQHCAHRGGHTTLTFQDWRPYRYYTFDVPMIGPISMRFTGEFHPEREGTQVTLLLGALPDAPWWHKVVIKLFAPGMVKQRRKAMERMMQVVASNESSRQAAASRLQGD